MKIVAIIEARMASSRLPGKVMLPILGKPTLQLMVNRVLKSKYIDSAMIATTMNPADDTVWRYGFGVMKYRGSEEDVLARVLGAARSQDADIIVELTGDCPLVDPLMIDKVIADYLLGGADFCYNRLEPGTPIGQDVRVFGTQALAEIERKTNDPADREHVSLHFWEHPEEYACRNVPTNLPEWSANLRLTIDTQEDYELVKHVFEELGADCTLHQIIDLFKHNQELKSINAHVRQKEVR